MMAVVSSGAIVGPALGGFLLDLLGWRAVFLVNIPMITLSIALGLAVLTNQPAGGRAGGPEQRRSGFDWQGATLSTGILLLLLLSVTYAHRFGWTSAPIMAGLGGFLVLLVGFIWWELRTPNPMLDLRYFRMPVFSCGVSAAFLTFMGGISVFFLTPFYLQGVLGYSPTQTGLALVPGAVCMLFLGPLSGRLSDRYGWRALTVGGLALITASLFILSRLTAESTLATVLPGLILQSCGMGLFFSPNASSVLSSVSRESYGGNIGLPEPGSQRGQRGQYCGGYGHRHCHHGFHGLRTEPGGGAGGRRRGSRPRLHHRPPLHLPGHVLPHGAGHGHFRPARTPARQLGEPKKKSLPP